MVNSHTSNINASKPRKKNTLNNGELFKLGNWLVENKEALNRNPMSQDEIAAMAQKAFWAGGMACVVAGV